MIEWGGNRWRPRLWFESSMISKRTWIELGISRVVCTVSRAPLPQEDSPTFLSIPSFLIHQIEDLRVEKLWTSVHRTVCYMPSQVLECGVYTQFSKHVCIFLIWLICELQQFRLYPLWNFWILSLISDIWNISKFEFYTLNFKNI